MAPEGAGVNPPKASKADEGVYFGSGLGALEPLFRTAKAEGDELRARRNAALDAVKAARATPEQRKAGEALRMYFTSERDLWAARANQALDIVTRKVLPKKVVQAQGHIHGNCNEPRYSAGPLSNSHCRSVGVFPLLLGAVALERPGAVKGEPLCGAA